MTNLQKKIIYSFAAVILVMLLVSAYLAHTALWGSGFLFFQVTPPTDVVDRVMTLEKSGGSIELSAADLNGILSLYLKEVKTSQDVSISGIYTGISAGKIDFYVPFKYKGWGFMLSSEGQFVYAKDNFSYVPSAFRIGTLNLPVDYVLKKLSGHLRKDAGVRGNSIIINKSVLPFDVSSLSIQGDEMVVLIQKSMPVSLKPVQSLKAAQSSTAAQGNATMPVNSNEQTGETAREALLSRASSELNGVISEVKTAKEKEIIGEIQSVVDKMSADPAYPYKSEEDAVKSEYDRLSQGEKEDIKNAILDNMEADTIRQIRSAFEL